MILVCSRDRYKHAYKARDEAATWRNCMPVFMPTPSPICPGRGGVVDTYVLRTRLGWQGSVILRVPAAPRQPFRNGARRGWSPPRKVEFSATPARVRWVIRPLGCAGRGGTSALLVLYSSTTPVSSPIWLWFFVSHPQTFLLIILRSSPRDRYIRYLIMSDPYNQYTQYAPPAPAGQGSPPSGQYYMYNPSYQAQPPVTYQRGATESFGNAQGNMGY